MKYEIKNRFTGEVQFTAEIDCEDDAPMNVKTGLAVRWALKNRANLSNADLRNADLSVANLFHADLEGADLSGANLFCANLSGAYLFRANLDGANLFCANLAGADLESADLRGAKLRTANLAGTDLRAATLDGADLEGANLYCANLHSASLVVVNQDGANWDGVNSENTRGDSDEKLELSDAYLKELYLNGRRLSDRYLLNACGHLSGGSKRDQEDAGSDEAPDGDPPSPEDEKDRTDVIHG